MNRTLAGAVALALVAGFAAFAEEDSLTLTTYYPSPRGVYDELRANRYTGVETPGRYVLDMTDGTLQVAQVVLQDSATSRRYGLTMDDGRLLLTDLEEGKSFMILELPEQE